jgi:hypoxanthine phosphoribosyltransferase
MNDKLIVDDLVFKKYIDQQSIKSRVGELTTSLNNYYEGKQPVIIGVLNGCIYFMMDLLKETTFDYSIEFIRVKSYVGMNSSKLSVDLFSSDNIKGKHVLIIEDIIDTGKTISKICNKINDLSPVDIQVATLLHKVDVNQSSIKISWSGFDIDDKFVIGYGLDYNSLFRNLKDIYIKND